MRLCRLFVLGLLVPPMFACGGEPSPPQEEEPGLELRGPASLSTVCGTVSLEAVVTRGTVEQVRFTAKSDLGDPTELAVDTEAPFTVDWNTALFPNGNYRVSATTTAAGRQITHSVAYVVSNVEGGCPVAPIVSITAPASGALVSQSFPVRVQATDEDAVTHVELSIDGTLVQTLTSAPFETTVSLQSSQGGERVLAAVAWDADGHSSRAEVNVRADLAPPTISFASPQVEEVHASTFDVVVEPRDDVAVERVELHADGQLVHTLYSAPYRWSWPASPWYGCGPHTIEAIVKDVAGKSQRASVRFFQASDACDRDCDGLRASAASCGGNDCDDTTSSVGAYRWDVQTIVASTATETYGAYSAITVDADGHTHLAFSEDQRGGLHYWTSGGGGVVAVEPPRDDGSRTTFQDLSLKVAATGNVHLGYNKLPPLLYNTNPWYATNASGAWVTQEVDASSDSSTSCSLDLDSNGKVHIAYSQHHDLKYATNASGAWTVTQVDGTSSDVGLRASLAIDRSDRVHVVYMDRRRSSAVYAMKGAGGWVEETVPGMNADSPSLALEPDGTPVFSNVLANWLVELARKGDSGWVKEEVSRGSGARSLALDASGRPHLAFWSDRSLRYAHRPPTGSGFVLETVGTSGSADPAEGKLALGPDGRPHFVYVHHGASDEVRLATGMTCP